MFKSYHEMSYLSSSICHMLCVMGLILMLSSCTWHEAKEVIAVADSLDQTEHVIYDDTAALGKAIRCLDNPFGRVLMSNTLGKAYYYIGRNYSISNQIAKAAGCYIEADRLQIDDPIYRGRVNSCMGYICAQNRNDSLALIFYERASEAFKESDNEWRYAQSLLNIGIRYIKLNQLNQADSILQLAETYELDSLYCASYLETKGLYYYQQKQYDSSLVYFTRGLDYWKGEETKSFSYLKIMQGYYSSNISMDSAVQYAHKVILTSNNPNYISNAYYCLMLDAKNKNDIELLSRYSHARTDSQRLLREGMIKYVEAIPILEDYLQNPHLWWRKLRIIFAIVAVLFLFFGMGLWRYRKRSNAAHEQLEILSAHVRTQEEDLLRHQSLLEFEQNRLNILEKYHTPHKRWRNYLLLKRDIAPWMHEWLQVLDTLSLSEQEKIFCIISLIYPHMTDVEIADFICYSKAGIRVFKNRIFKKLGVASVDFADFLRNLSISR